MRYNDPIMIILIKTDKCNRFLTQNCMRLRRDY